jgi:hypothetical protein
VRFLVTCAKETLINEWDVHWTKNNEGVHSFGWHVKRKRAGGNQDNCKRMPMIVGYQSCE